MISLDQNVNAKSALIWIISPIVLLLNRPSLRFYGRSCIFRIIDFSIVSFKLSIQEWKNIHTSMIEISVFEIGLDQSFSLNGFYFKSKIVEGSHGI